MSEPIQALWFEDVSFLNEPMFDTPLGRFSIRQTFIFLLFGLLAYAFFSLTSTMNTTAGAVGAGATFLLGAAVFTRKVKTVSPEKHLLLILTANHTRKVKRETENVVRGKERFKPPKRAQNMLLSATLNAPVKVVGVLRDPASGKPLLSRSFEVSVDGAAISKGFTDEEGFFAAYFVPDRYGVFKVEVKPEGYAEGAQQITVQVKPREVLEVA